MDIYRELRANEAVRTAALLSDGPWKVRDGVLGRSMEDMIHLAAQIQVPATEEAVGRAIAEMISCAAATCGGVHPLPDKERKIDFFLLHNVTASLSLSVLNQQSWIKIEDKARLIEYKARLDLVWYAGSAAPEVDLEQHLVGYVPAPDAVNSRGTNWQTLYAAVNQHHDDGHVAKFVRACRNGEEATAPYEKLAETLDWLPVHGDLWLKLAQLCYDTTYQYADGQKKWVWGTGFAAMWENVRDTK
ncbi:hypothetical protein CMQ_2579 [Grosmannia clavigera kw1407]|uniref:Uncharacterized protein n=1 Tax=Grosmannia clavigera (strain kw1407 / UAMH 11150) TaxID=655863 RepID=F0XGJ5_GROCL|nr:uncharacterized protein CMQ_2579 [Grosmannia clavigera kw1407]EFX02650.1 hypothetical protein CMQ_2579 [Grosmannia clavigera kw1407]